MVESFVLGGEPGSIRASARSWNQFSTSTSTASEQVRRLDAGEFIGDEGDTFRGKVKSDLPPNLDTASQAWGIVGTALRTYADQLERFQTRMASLKSQYDSQQQKVASAQASLASARQSDRAEEQRVKAAKADLADGETLPPSSYRSGTAGAQTSVNEAQQDVANTLAAAATVRQEHRTAVDACCREINRAKDMRFEKPPGFFGRIKNSVVDWIADNADLLKKISGVLKVISAIAGVLSFIPVLNVVMGPIALAAGAAALAIDVAVMLATGKGSWLEIGIDAATMMLPGVGKLAGKALKSSAPNLVRAMDRGGLKLINGVKGSKIGKGFNAFTNTKVGSLLVTGPGKMLNGVNSTVGAGLSKIPGADKFTNAAARRAEGGYIGFRTRPVSKSKQAAMDRYKKRLTEKGYIRNPGTSGAPARYQRKFSDTEYNIKENGGNFTKGAQWADGLDSRDASIIETKFKYQDSSKSQRNLEPGEAKPTKYDYDKQRSEDVDQMRAYGDRIAESSNPMERIVYNVAQPSQVDYYLDIAADAGVADKVIVAYRP